MKDVICPKCNHKWKYKNFLFRATCPSCGNKVWIRNLKNDKEVKQNE